MVDNRDKLLNRASVTNLPGSLVCRTSPMNNCKIISLNIHCRYLVRGEIPTVALFVLLLVLSVDDNGVTFVTDAKTKYSTSISET